MDREPALDPSLVDDCAPRRDAVFRLAPPPPELVEPLRALVRDAAQQRSDSLVVAVGDTLVAYKCFAPPAPRAVHSVSKSVVSLALGVLVAEGKLASLQVPVSAFFPEWNDGLRARVTLAQLMTHTAGIADDMGNGGRPPLFSAPDALAFARRAKVTTEPGSAFAYSNEGIMLLAGVVEVVAAMPFDVFVARRVFAPIDVTDASWEKDLAGHALAPGGLRATPLDLVRLARLARDGGVWQGRALLPATWIAEATTEPVGAGASPFPHAMPCYGALFWLLRAGCGADPRERARPLGPVEGFYADGFGGNYAVVVPSKGLLAVRTKAPSLARPELVEATSFGDFPHRVAELPAARVATPVP